MTALAVALRKPRYPTALRLAVLVVGGAVLAWLGTRYVALSPDSRYSLAWGAELLRGGRPNFLAPQLVTPHPLPIALGGVLSLLGPDGAAQCFRLLAVVAFGALVYAAFRLGRTLGGIAAGVLAAALIATRPRLDFFAAHGFIDVPFAALVLLAAALCAEAPSRNWWKVLGLLGLAGLLRPEAWALSALFLLWVIPGLPRPRALKAAALGAAAPALWLGFDLAITGNALHSLHETQAATVAQGRPTGTENVVETVRSGVSGLIGPAATVGALAVAASVAVAAAVGRRLPPRLAAALPGAPLVSAHGAHYTVAVLVLGGIGAFAALALAGLPLNDRYLLVPALAVAVLAAAAAAQPRSPVLLAALVVVVGGTVAGASDDAHATARVLALARDKRAADGDLERLLARPDVRAALARCAHVRASGSARAAVASLLGRDPAKVVISRSPLPPPDRSALSTSASMPPGTPGAIREGAWTYVSGCRPADPLRRGPP